MLVLKIIGHAAPSCRCPPAPCFCLSQPLCSLDRAAPSPGRWLPAPSPVLTFLWAHTFLLPVSKSTSGTCPLPRAQAPPPLLVLPWPGGRASLPRLSSSLLPSLVGSSRCVPPHPHTQLVPAPKETQTTDTCS